MDKNIGILQIKRMGDGGEAHTFFIQLDSSEIAMGHRGKSGLVGLKFALWRPGIDVIESEWELKENDSFTVTRPRS